MDIMIWTDLIQTALTGLGADLESVKIVRDKKTVSGIRKLTKRLFYPGESKGFAFAKFFSIEHARKFVDAHYPHITISGVRIRVDFSRNSYTPDSNRYSQPSGMHGIPGAAFSQATLAPAGPGNPGLHAQGGVNDGQQDVGQTAHMTLLVRGLDTMTTEETLYSAFKAINPPPLQVRLIRDRLTHLSWGFAFIEYKDMPSAAMALSQIGPPELAFSVDGKTVQSSWAHEGSFTPVYGYSTWAVSSRKDLQGNPVWVQYWDEGAYASAVPAVPEEATAGPATGPGKEAKTKKRKKPSSPKAGKNHWYSLLRDSSILTGTPQDSVDDVMSAFYATVGADISSSIKEKDAKFIVGAESSATDKKPLITIQGKKQQVQIQKWTAISQDAKAEEEEPEPTVTTQLKAHIQKFVDKAAQDTQSVTRWRNRAAERRRAFGQPARVDSGRTQTRTITEEPTKHGIPTSNVGSRLLEKQGWKPGQGLGRESQGIVAPIQAVTYGAGIGLGAASLLNPHDIPGTRSRLNNKNLLEDM
ncbi:hypothetical protein HDU93_002659 [Gonapodya sp. JEL0774]|nr:hypothetical protein HDU93_002659 [Gonapodya sp. JEL0774]